MLKLFWKIIKFALCIYVISLICIVIGTAFEFLAKYWWLIGLCAILSIAAYFYAKYRSTQKEKQEIIALHAEVERHYLEYQKQKAIIEPDIPNALTCESAWLAFGGEDAELLNVDLMDGHDFEYWCSDLLYKTGFQNVEVTQASGDDGVDILAGKDGIKYAIQCKRYSSDLGNKPVQEVHTGKAVYNCHVGAVMTNRYFTEGGRRAAAATGTLLWDRDWLRERLKEVQSAAKEKMAQPPVLWNNLEGDEMLPAAVDIIWETGVVSVSMIQRRLNMGYARAARLVDEMEQRGIVGPFRGSKPREILMTKEQWNLRKHDFY